MSILRGTIILVLGVILGGAGAYWYARPPAAPPSAAIASPASVPAADRTIVYYRDPGGAPYWSATPKQDDKGRDYLPVYEDEEISFDPEPKKAPAAAGPRKILYYRNPMGLADTS